MILWRLTITANLLLLAVIAYRKTWEILPIFANSQIIEYLLSLMLIALYCIPAVPDSVYYPVWIMVDVICLILEIVSAIEILLYCSHRGIAWLALIFLLHATLKFYEYMGQPTIYRYRIILNLALTVLLIPCVYRLEAEHHG